MPRNRRRQTYPLQITASGGNRIQTVPSRAAFALTPGRRLFSGMRQGRVPEQSRFRPESETRPWRYGTNHSGNTGVPQGKRIPLLHLHGLRATAEPDLRQANTCPRRRKGACKNNSTLVLQPLQITARNARPFSPASHASRRASNARNS